MTIETVETPSGAAPASDANPAADTPAKLDKSTAASLSEDELLSRLYDEAAAEDEDESKAGSDPDEAVDDGAEADKGSESKRDASGKFVAKNPELKVDEEAEADKGPAKEAADEKPEAPEKAPAQEKVDKSKVDYSGHQRGWSEEQKAKFAKLAPEAQALVVERQTAQQGALTKTQQDLADLRKSADPLVAVVKENADYFDELSVAFKSTPADIIKGLLSTEQTLRYGTFQEKQATLLALAREYGVPLQQVETDADADPSLPTSEHHALVHDLRQKITRLEARLGASERQSRSTADADLSRSVAEFAATVGEDGQPKYPHFEIVRASMGQILEQGKASTLHEAYELAVKPLTEQIERAATARRQAEEARVAAEKAKRAGSVNVSTAAKAVTRYASEDEMLAAEYERAMAS